VKTSVLAPRNPNTQPGVYTKADLEAALQKQRTELQQKFESKQKAALAAMEQDHVLKLAVHERMSQVRAKTIFLTLPTMNSAPSNLK
jgi:hypothetical protein